MARFENEVLAALPRLRRYARSLSRNAADADDLVQDCLETALRAQSQWRGAGLTAWLRRIMTNTFLNQTRRKPGRTAFVDISDLEISDDVPLSDPLARRRLLLAVEALPPEFRAVLMLVVVEGQSYAEASVVLDVPIGTVMSRLSRARRLLNENLNAHNIVPLRGRS